MNKWSKERRAKYDATMAMRKALRDNGYTGDIPEEPSSVPPAHPWTSTPSHANTREKMLNDLRTWRGDIDYVISVLEKLP